MRVSNPLAFFFVARTALICLIFADAFSYVDADAEAQFILLNDLPCDAESEAAWIRLRELLRSRSASFSGRMPFGVFQSDMDLFDSLNTDVSELRVEDIFMSTKVLVAPTIWTNCAIGAVACRAFSLLTRLGVKTTSVWRAAADLVTLVLALPWAQVLLGDWPLFETLATLARWASPHGADQNSSSIGRWQQHGGTFAAADMPASVCDAAEVGALAVSRHLLGQAWRSRDPLHPAITGSVNGSEILAEQVLAGVLGHASGAVWGGKAGNCRWTEHPQRFLGGLVGVEAHAGLDVMEAMEACDKDASCAGITGEANPSNDPVQYSLRRGQPFLENSPTGEVSYARWCDAKPTIVVEGVSDSSASCPFGKAVGLFAAVLRQLRSGSMRAFSPELLAEAQSLLTRWSSSVGAAVTGHEAWATEWPLWELLGRLQQRVALLRSPAVGVSAPPPWAVALQSALGLDDEAWRLATTEMEKLAHDSGSGAVPKEMRQAVRCADGRQCVAEFYARMHLLLYRSKHLPLRDQIFMGPEDALGRTFLERAKEITDGKEDDWASLIGKDGAQQDISSRNQDINRIVPAAHPLQVDRRQLANFIHEIRPLIADKPLGRCLEWDQPFLLIRAFEGVCRWSDVFSYSEPDPNQPLMGMPGRHEYTYGTRHYWGDLLHHDGLGIEPDTFDLIMVPFVFEHVAQPFIGMKNLAYVLRSGGYIIWSAPMFQQYHGSPHDYFRYTPKGAQALAESAGLEVVRLHAPGDLGLVSGVMMGMLLPYWSEEQVFAQADPVHPEDSPRHPLNVFMLLRKPRRVGSNAD